MKIVTTFLLFAFSLLKPAFSLSQDTNTIHRFYLSFGMGKVNEGTPLSISGNYIHKSGWGINLHSLNIITTADRLPADYQAGFCAGIGDCDPDDRQITYSLGILRQFNTKKDALKIVLELGAASVQHIEYYFIPNPNTGIFGSNYTTTKKTSNGFGFTFRSSLRYDITRHWGIELAGLFHHNEFHDHFGFEFMMNLGILRRKDYDLPSAE